MIYSICDSLIILDIFEPHPLRHTGVGKDEAPDNAMTIFTAAPLHRPNRHAVTPQASKIVVFPSGPADLRARTVIFHRADGGSRGKRAIGFHKAAGPLFLYPLFYMQC